MQIKGYISLIQKKVPIFISEFLKDWLGDLQVDDFDHLHIEMNNSSIKCTIVERLLNPTNDFKKKEFLVSLLLIAL